MSNRQEQPDDGDLEQLLHAADPASSLPTLPLWQLERLKETAVTPTTYATRTSHRRRNLFASLCAGGLAAAAIAGGVLLTAPAADTGGGVTALTVPSSTAPAGMCAEPSADALASSTLAFRGMVTSIADGTVTLAVTDSYAGTVDKTVTVPQGEPDAQVDGASPVFTNGHSYLVATTGKVVRSCGLTGPDSASLAKLYADAFHS
jgi:hypothetical protein